MPLLNLSNTTNSILVVVSDEEPYLSQYKALRSSIRTYCPTLPIFCAIYGDPSTVDDKGDLFQHVININSKPEWNRSYFPSTYTTGAYLAALRPRIVNYLLESFPIEKLALIGADMYFYAPAINIFNFLPEGYNLAVTPHVYTQPPHDGKFPNLRMIQLTGHLNADFILYRNIEYVRDFCKWMAGELQERCVGDHHNGIFFDQTYLGFCYIFLPNQVYTIEHIGINAAYYNLHERSLSKVGGNYFLNGTTSLICFQFSGFDGVNLSKYLKRKEQLTIDVVKLALEYNEKINNNHRA